MIRRLTAIVCVGLLGIVLAWPATIATAQEAPRFWVGLHFDGIAGDSWLAGVTLTVTADDPDTPLVVPDITRTPTTDARGGFMDELPGVEPGWLVTVSDGVTTETHTVRNLTITYVDPASEIMYGTADPGSELNAALNANGDTGPDQWVTADPVTGEWTAEFSGIYDITPGMNTRALQFGEFDSNFTFTDWQVPATLDELLDDMVADGSLPNAGIARSILQQAERAPAWVLANHLSSLVARGVITQQTMDQILAFAST